MSELQWNLDEITMLIQATMDELDLPGFAVSLVAGENSLVEQTYGVLDTTTLAPITPQTLFRLGSITKVFTAHLLMQFVEQGRLTLDDVVVGYIPELGAIKGGDAIRVKHLVTHTSGLPIMPPTLSFPDDLDGIANVQFPTIEELVQDLHKIEFLSAPGTHYAYSNYGFALLGDMLAKIAQQPYRTLIEDHILQPLGMIHTHFDPQPFNETLATGYITFFGESVVMPPVDIGGFTPAGQLFSTISDMVKFCRAQWAEPSLLLNSRTRQQMQTPNWHTDQIMAVGWKVVEIDDARCIYHGGADPGYISYLIIEPKLQLGVILMTNAGTQPERIEALGNDIMLNMIVMRQ